jgi:MFS family permease
MCASREESSLSDGIRLSPATREDLPGQNEQASIEPTRWITGPFVRLLATNMALGFGFSCFFLLPKHLTLNHAASAGMVGAVMGIFGLTCVLAVPFLDRAVGALGLGRTLVYTQALLAACSLGFVAHSAPGAWVLGLRVLQGLATAAMMTAGTALVCELAPAYRLQQAMGLAGGASLLMNALAPAVAEPVAARYGFSAVFLMSAAALCIGCVIARKLPTRRVSTPRSSLSSALSAPGRSRPVLLALGAVGAGFHVTVSFLAPLALSRGAQAVSGFFIAYTIAALSIRLLGGALTNRLGAARTATGGMVGYGLFIALLAGVGPRNLALLGVGFGLSHGALFPALMALLFEGAAPAERAKLSSLAIGVMNLGMLSVFALGQAANHVGLPAIFVATGMSIFLASRWIRGKGVASESMAEESRLESV